MIRATLLVTEEVQDHYVETEKEELMANMITVEDAQGVRREIILKDPMHYGEAEIGSVTVGQEASPVVNYQKGRLWLSVRMPAHVDDILSGDAGEVAYALVREKFKEYLAEFEDSFSEFASRMRSKGQ